MAERKRRGKEGRVREGKGERKAMERRGGGREGGEEEKEKGGSCPGPRAC